MSERSKRWKEFETYTIPEYIEKIKNAKKQFKQSRDKLYDTIEELGDKIKEFFPEGEASSILKHYLKGTISTRTIERALNKKKKNIEESTSQFATVSQIEDRKVIEVSAGTNTQSVSEPQPQPQPPPQQHDDDLIDLPDYVVNPPEEDRPQPPQINQELEVLKSKLIAADNDVMKMTNEVKKRDSRIFNLETQLKTITERKIDKPKTKIDPKKLQIDDGREFENTETDLKISASC